MTISRPRASILSLFDPLTQVTEPSTPPRNNESPVFDSDKENDGPYRTDLTLTTFFDRTYKPNHPSPKRLTKRLVDVGDVTIQDIDPAWPNSDDEDSEAFEAALKEFDDDEGDTLTFRQIAASATPKWNATTPKASGSSQFDKSNSQSPLNAPRTPLGDLPVEEDATPVLRHQPMKRHAVTSPSKLSSVHIFVSEPDTEEDDGEETPVFANPSLGATELQKKLLSPQSGSLGTSQSSLNLTALSTPGDLLIAERSDVSISTSFGSDFNCASTPAQLEVPSRRRSPANNSSENANRHSVDLTSSFQMQINDSEASFDLLNDKISLFDSKCSMEMNSREFTEGSFDLDFEAAKLGAFAVALVAQQKAANGVPLDLEDEDFAPPPEGDIFTSKKLQVPEAGDSQVPITRLVQLVSPERKPTATTLRNPSPKATPAPVQTLVVTPKNVNAGPITVPPPVAGLRIVKRSRLPLEKAAAVAELSTGGATAPVLPAAPAKGRAKRATSPVSAASSRRLSVSTAEQPKVKISSRSVSPPEVQSAAPVPVGPRRTVIGTATTEPNRGIHPVPVPPVARRMVGMDGPRRVLVEDQDSSSSTHSRSMASHSRANSGRLPSSTLSYSATTGPRRIIPPSSSSSTLPPLSRGTHSRQVSSNFTATATGNNMLSTGMGTGLPKPVSRAGGSSIPQPASRTSRLAAPSSGLMRPSASREAGRTGTLRRVI